MWILEAAIISLMWVASGVTIGLLSDWLERERSINRQLRQRIAVLEEHLRGVALDLAAVYAEAGRGARIGALAKDLEIAGAGLPETEVAGQILRDLVGARPGRDLARGAREKAAVLATYMRRTCRVRFPGRQTLPWV